MLTVQKLINGSTGDPCLYLDFPGQYNALLFDAGELTNLDAVELGDIGAVFMSHFHMDHFVGFDRVMRQNIDRKKTIQIFGPDGTTAKMAARLGCYSFHKFPFMQLQFDVHEITAAGVTRTEMHCQNDFAPRPSDAKPPAFKDGVCYDSPECRVSYLWVEHSVPCINYAMDLKRGYRFDAAKAEKGVLKTGPWVAQVAAELRKKTMLRKKTVRIAPLGLELELDAVAKDYFTLEPKAKIVFCTDTRKTPQVWPPLVEFCRGATQLYADAYYPHADRDKAQKYGHLTAREAGELARDAEVEHLTLIHLGKSYAARFPELLAEAREVFANTDYVL